MTTITAPAVNALHPRRDGHPITSRVRHHRRADVRPDLSSCKR